MFGDAASYLVLTVLLGVNSLGHAAEKVVHDESLANKIPTNTVKKNLGKNRALGMMDPYWTQVGATLNGVQEGELFGYAVDISDDGGVLIATGEDYNSEIVDATNVTLRARRAQAGTRSKMAKSEGRTQAYKRVPNKKTKKPMYIKMGQSIVGEEFSANLGNAAKISADGKILAVGSDDTNDDAGHIQAYFYRPKQKMWEPKGGRILGEFADDELGWYFDLSANGLTIVAGSAGHNATGDDNGKTEIYRFNKRSGDWELKGNPIIGIHNITDDWDAYYGWSVSIDEVGERVMTSGLYDGKEYGGAVKIYDYAGEDADWIQIGSTLYGPEYYDEFGQSVAMSKDGSTIVIGAGCYYYCDSEYNHYVHIYRWDDEKADWGLIGDITPSDGDTGFGVSVSTSDDGERIAFATAVDKGYGLAKVYEYNGPMDWTPVGQNLLIEELNLDGDDADPFGHLVTLSGDGTHLVVGAPEAGKSGAGLVRAYDLANNTAEFPPAGCVDANNKIKFKWPTGKRTVYKNCKYVAKKKAQRCKNNDVALMCPHACGKCFEAACGDGPLPWKAKKTEVNCDWVAEKPILRCKGNQLTVCHETCGTLMNELLCAE